MLNVLLRRPPVTNAMNIPSTKPRNVARRASSSARAGKSRAQERPRDSQVVRAVSHLASRRADHADVDSLYLAEMAEAQVLTPERERCIAERLVTAERALLDAVVHAPSGCREISELVKQVVSGARDVRTMLLNPDQAGLDLDRARQQVLSALVSACSPSGSQKNAAVDTLSLIRLDGHVLAPMFEAIHAGAASSADDAKATAAIDQARRQLKLSKEELVVGNLRLVVLFARKYLGRGVALLDLVQEGNLGLMRAADKFDHTRGFRFSTYASWWIKQALQRALLDRTMRLPVHVADDRRRVAKVRTTFFGIHRREPTAEEIAKTLGFARERVENILSIPPQPASLDTPMGDSGDATLADLVPTQTEPPDAAVAQHALGSHLATLMGALTAREQEVLKLRFGIGGAREHTLEEVGRCLALTRERIRQIERTALDKLRNRELHSYLEG